MPERPLADRAERQRAIAWFRKHYNPLPLYAGEIERPRQVSLSALEYALLTEHDDLKNALHLLIGTVDLAGTPRGLDDDHYQAALAHARRVIGDG